MSFLRYLIIGVVAAMDCIGDLEYYQEQYHPEVEEDDIFGCVDELLAAGLIAYADDYDPEDSLWDRLFEVTPTGEQAHDAYHHWGG